MHRFCDNLYSVIIREGACRSGPPGPTCLHCHSFHVCWFRQLCNRPTITRSLFILTWNCAYPVHSCEMTHCCRWCCWCCQLMTTTHSFSTKTTKTILMFLSIWHNRSPVDERLLPASSTHSWARYTLSHTHSLSSYIVSWHAICASLSQILSSIVIPIPPGLPSRIFTVLK